MHLVAGTQLKNGQYILNHVLDQQGIGWTYRATQTQLQQTVLVKTLNPTLRSHPQFAQICQDFIQRSQQLSRLRHPSLVRVLDIFTDLQDMPFVVLEYLQGLSLNDWMNDRKRGEAEVIQLLRQMSHVLSYLQQHNLPHANLKPRNILYSSDSTNPDKTQLILVGFAPSLRLSEMIATRNPYSAPELLHGNVTANSDLYSLAGLLYYCLTQHPPAQTEVENDRFPLLSLLKPGAQRLLRSGSQPNSNDRPTTPELWLSQLSKSRPASPVPPRETSTATQTSAETHIQAPVVPQPIDLSQKPTYLQDATHLLRDSSPQPTQVQPPSTQIQEPAPKISPPENLPHYRTSPITAFAEFPKRPEPTPARYIPDAPSTEHLMQQPVKQKLHDRSPSHPSPKSHRPSIKSKYLPSPRILKLTLLFAALAGLAFGIILRIQASQRPGSSFFHTGQSFPPREWKGTLMPSAEVNKDVFVEPGSQSPSQPASTNPKQTDFEPPPSQPAEPINQFPVRSQPFDPDDVLIPETSPLPSSPTPELSPTPDGSAIDANPSSISNPIKPKKSP